MKRLSAIVLVLVLGLATASAPAPRPRPSGDLQRLARLYEDGRCFELRDALGPFKDVRSPELEFFRGVVDQVFNRLDDAVPRLKGFLASEAGPVRMLDKEAGVLVADAYRKLGRYRDAAAALHDVRTRFGRVLDDGERANYLDQEDLWSALSDVPPQSVEIATDAAIRMTNRHIPVRIGNRDLFVSYDTGADLSVLCKSVADEVGIPIYGSEVKVRTVTGESIRGRIGVVPELRLGSLVVRNAVFFVLPDAVFPPFKVGPGADRRGLLGAPILVGLREFTETKDGQLIVPAEPKRLPVENMFLSGFLPVVEAIHRSARLSLCLDTGAATTVLFPPFYKRYRGEIDSRSSLREITLGGLGSSRAVPVRLLDEFAFRTGGLALALRKVAVQTRETLPLMRIFHGTLGVDILSQCQSMTLNFESMSFILEK